MKRFLMAIALACVLSVSAFAGDAHTVGVPSPNDPPAGDGNQGNGGRTDDGNQGAGGLALLILDLLF